jgi:hypothetical protein
MKKYLNLSTKTRQLTAENSGHFIHLTDFPLVEKALKELA